MSNHASVKIYFDGSSKQLEKVKDLIITEGKFSQNTIDFSYVKPMLPGISNKNIFELFGCDWNKFILKQYTSEEIQKFEEKVHKFLKQEGWIGFRDSYINESSRDATAYYKDKTLVIEAEFSWYCPTLFFVKIAQDFQLTMKALEFVEGNETIISYMDSKGKCVDIKNSSESILKSQEFRDYSVELGLHKPEELVVVAMFSGNKSLAKKIIQDYKVSSDEMSFAVNKLKDYAEDHWDIYQSSPFIGLNYDKVKENNTMELMHQFAKLEDQIENKIHPKKLK